MQFKRNREAGFTLIETLLAAAILAAFAIPVISAFSQAARQDGPRLEHLAVKEFAYSLLEERVGMRAIQDDQGTYEGTFTYTVAVTPHPSGLTTRFDPLIRHELMTVTVRLMDRPLEVEISQVIARKVVP